MFPLNCFFLQSWLLTLHTGPLSSSVAAPGHLICLMSVMTPKCSCLLNVCFQPQCVPWDPNSNILVLTQMSSKYLKINTIKTKLFPTPLKLAEPDASKWDGYCYHFQIKTPGILTKSSFPHTLGFISGSYSLLHEFGIQSLPTRACQPPRPSSGLLSKLLQG